MYDLSLQHILLRGVAALAVTVLYGQFAVWAARLLGDEGPTHDGRDSWNPLVHASAVGILGMWALQYGWIRPLDVRPEALKNRGWTIVLVPVLASAMLVAASLVLDGARTLVGLNIRAVAAGPALTLIDMITFTATGTALLNLVPLPPLLMGLVHRRVAPALAHRLEPHAWIVGVVLLAVLARVGAVRSLLDAARRGLGG